jgi:hypothetical protein
MVTLIHQQLSKSAAVLDLGLWVRTTRDRVVFGFAPAAVVESLYGLYEAAARAQNYGIEVDHMVPFSHGEIPIFPSPVAGVTRPRRTAEFTALPRNNEGAMNPMNLTFTCLEHGNRGAYRLVHRRHLENTGE